MQECYLGWGKVYILFREVSSVQEHPHRERFHVVYTSRHGCIDKFC